MLCNKVLIDRDFGHRYESWPNQDGWKGFLVFGF